MTSFEIQDLKHAAIRGDVEFLRNNVGRDQPIQCYLPCLQLEGEFGNIFHYAVIFNKEEFVKEAISILPSEAVQQLLLQLTDDPNKSNPLHMAADNGNVEIVKMLLQVYRCLPSDLSKRPWLQQNSDGYNPCYVAVCNNFEECALEMLKLDKELLCNEPPDGRYRFPLLVIAIQKGLDKLTLEILESPHFVVCTGVNGYTAFHAISFLEGSEKKEEFFRLLLEREPELYKQTDNIGNSACHQWAFDGKVWPFKCLLESQDIVPNVKRDLANLVSSTNKEGYNILHHLVKWAPIEKDAMKIAELLVQIYKQEASPPESGISEAQYPWLMRNDFEETPLSSAIARRFEQVALYILSLDANTIVTSKRNVLFMAISLGCHDVATTILEIVDKQGWTQLFRDHQHRNQYNVLYLAPLCKIDFCARLIEEHIELLKEVDKGGLTILHSWIKYDNVVGLFKFILKSKWRSSFLKLIDAIDYEGHANPIHYAATSTHDATEVVKLLVEAYKEQNPRMEQYSQPWFRKDRINYGPLHLAICNHHEDLALYILSLHQSPHLNELLDSYKPEHFTVFLAIENNCGKVAQAILSRLDKRRIRWTKCLKNSSDGCNILHPALLLKDVEFGKWLVNEAPEFITEKDNNGRSPWKRAFEVGCAWFIEEVLQKDPSPIYNEPMAWMEACKNGHVSALYALIDYNVGTFRELCIYYKDSPLHHIQLPCLTNYEEFLAIERMKDFINVQNFQGETPLHRAIRRRDIFLTETLLNIDKIIYDIKDEQAVTAMDLLAHLCKEDDAWDLMCKRNGLDPSIKTTYFQHKTNLLDVRASLFVVAALVTTVTFTAGFTLPGGFNQNGGAILGKMAAFIVFLVSDTLALVFSTLVLICLTLSMVYEPSKSLILIDRSMVLLRMALNFTLVAFMTGVYVVISPESLWATILIIVITSSLIIISFDKNVLFKVMDKFFPAANKECKDPMRLVQLGYEQDEQDSLLSDYKSHKGGGENRSQDLLKPGGKL